MALSQWALFRADAVFAGIWGFSTLDTQSVITPESMVEQIRSYSEPAVEAYELFAAIDYVFPPAAGLLLSATTLWLIRRSNRATSWSVPEWIALLCLLPVMFDYVENIFLAFAVITEGAFAAVTGALVGKALKLASLAVSSALLPLTAMYALVVIVSRLLRRNAPEKR
ncbi:hypothetical protein ACPW96_04970 [Micromonospora sp. DT81.3]|uniref:hypothetical protein n=1 Tax=Micromonospora sp. DT81.3 TaxID=3416523 RepID=UPI003CF80B27